MIYEHIKIQSLLNPELNIPQNIGPGGTESFLDITERRELQEKLNKVDKGSLSKKLAYLYDINDLIGRNKNINLIADDSVVMKPIFNEDNLSGANLETIDKPIGDKHNSPIV